MKRLFLVMTAVLVAAASAVPMQAADTPTAAPLIVGEHVEIDLSTSVTSPRTWKHEIHFPDAEFIKVRFSRFDLPLGDTVTVSDPAGRMLHTYPGSAFTTDDEPGFWALSIVGHTAVVELRSAGRATSTFQGFDINKFARGLTTAEIAEANPQAPESTCGINERTDAVCYEVSHPTEFERSHSVARILQNGSSHCTGWRVGAGPHLMTNEHCITSQGQLNNMEFWFGYQRTVCESGGPAVPVIVTGDQFLIDDNPLDFALVTINDLASVDSFGFLELDPRTPILDEEIYISQHGAGNPKEFGIDSDVNDPNFLCAIDDPIRNGSGVNTDTGYRCDTTGGSSGSPVFARSSHKVIALHHFGTGGGVCTGGEGGNMNAGVRIELIEPLIAPFLGTIFTDGFESGDTSSWSTTVP